MLMELADIHCSRLTRWSAQTNAASRLDRVYATMPGWLLLNLVVKTFVVGDVLDRNLRSSSDQIPTGVRTAVACWKPAKENDRLRTSGKLAWSLRKDDMHKSG